MKEPLQQNIELEKIKLEQQRLEHERQKDQKNFVKEVLLVAIAILSLVGTWVSNYVTNNSERVRQLELEERKFEYAILQKAVDTEDKVKAAQNIRFLVDADIISEKSKTFASYLDSPEELPAAKDFASNIPNQPTPTIDHGLLTVTSEHNELIPTHLISSNAPNFNNLTASSGNLALPNMGHTGVAIDLTRLVLKEEKTINSYALIGHIEGEELVTPSQTISALIGEPYPSNIAYQLRQANFVEGETLEDLSSQSTSLFSDQFTCSSSSINHIHTLACHLGKSQEIQLPNQEADGDNDRMNILNPKSPFTFTNHQTVSNSTN